MASYYLAIFVDTAYKLMWKLRITPTLILTCLIVTLQVIVDQAEVNLALGANVSQSSIRSYDPNTVALRVVDNNTSTAWGNETCTRTQHEDNPWLMVELEDEYLINRVEITNRKSTKKSPVSDVACENGQLKISCDVAESIGIISAQYGRLDNTTCTTGRPAKETNQTDCKRDVCGKVREICDGHNKCSIYSKHNDTFDFEDPCRGTYKYLQVEYNCTENDASLRNFSISMSRNVKDGSSVLAPPILCHEQFKGPLGEGETGIYSCSHPAPFAKYIKIQIHGSDTTLGLCEVKVLGEKRGPVKSNMTRFTLFPINATWNTANKVCQHQGGRLVKVDTEIKHGIIEHFKQNQLDWNATLDHSNNDGYWVGMFDEEIPKQVFAWSGDCGRQGNWSNWDTTGEPSGADIEHCVRHMMTEGLWRTFFCDMERIFICENYQEGACKFERHQSTGIAIGKVFSQEMFFENAGTLEECEEMCSISGSLVNEEDCWAVLYKNTSSNSPVTCTGYFHVSPVAMLRSDVRGFGLDHYTFSVRVCYEATINCEMPANLRLDYPLSTCFAYRGTDLSELETKTCPRISTTDCTATESVVLGEASISTTTAPATTDTITTSPHAATTEGYRSTEPPPDFAKFVNTTEMTTFTLFEEEDTWDEANKMCRREDGHLLKVDSADKEKILEFFGEEEPWKSILNEEEYWIGMFDPTNTTGQVFRWASGDSCSTMPANDQKWNNWADGEPDRLHEESCVVQKKYGPGWKWKTKKCHRKFQYICENVVQACTFEKYADKTIQFRTNLTMGINSTMCQKLCLNDDANERAYKCWAYSHGPTNDGSAGNCSLYFTSNPVTVRDPSFRVTSPGSEAAVRLCFKGECYFQTYRDRAFRLSSNITKDVTLAKCEDDCVSGHAPGGEQCWGLEYKPTVDWSGNCTLYFSSNPVTMTDSSLRVYSNDSIASVRMCYSAGSVSMTKNPPNCEATATIARTDEPSTNTPSCPSGCRPVPPKMTKAESNAFMAPILESLDVKHLLNPAKKRKFFSARDDRPSAKGIGYSGGAILGMVFGLIFLMDLPRLIHDGRNAVHNLGQLLPRNRVLPVENETDVENAEYVEDLENPEEPGNVDSGAPETVVQDLENE